MVTGGHMRSQRSKMVTTGHRRTRAVTYMVLFGHILSQKVTAD